MAGEQFDVIDINGHQWQRVDPEFTRTNPGWHYPLWLVRQCNGNPREVERRTGVTYSGNVAKSTNT